MRARTPIMLALGLASAMACGSDERGADELAPDGAAQRDAAQSDAASALLDASLVTGSDAQTTHVQDARVDDPAVICAFDVGDASDDCVGHVCRSDAGTELALVTDGGWYASELAHSGAVCTRPLGAPQSWTLDQNTMLFALPEAERQELLRGMPVFVFKAEPDASPRPSPWRICTVPNAVDMPACPATVPIPKYESDFGCRGPEVPGCTECWSPRGSGSYWSASAGGTWYDMQTGTSTGYCLHASCYFCARCSFHDEQSLRDLGVRAECEPCPFDPGTDPCRAPTSCNCYCNNRALYSQRCPKR